MSDEKLCKDCKWVSVENEDWRYAKCLSPQSGTSLVSGEPRSAELYCEIMRRSEGHGRWCGKEGRFWEVNTDKANHADSLSATSQEHAA